MTHPPGQRLLRYDRRLGVRFVAGADEAGRGSLAGPLVVAGVLLDYGLLRGHRVQAAGAAERLQAGEPRDRVSCSTRVLGCRDAGVGAGDPGLRRSIATGSTARTSAGLRTVLADLRRAPRRCLVDGFRLGPLAPPHRAVVDGDTKSAAIAAASIVAKVTRDRVMRRLDALHPRYGFSRHVGYITPAHSAASARTGPASSTACRMPPSATRRSAVEPEPARRDSDVAGAAGV